MSLFNENPKSIYINIKELLALAVTDRHHTFHTPVFSNNSINKIKIFLFSLKFDQISYVSFQCITIFILFVTN